jgi:hypothetical protein
MFNIIFLLKKIIPPVMNSGWLASFTAKLIHGFVLHLFIFNIKILKKYFFSIFILKIKIYIFNTFFTF